MGETNAKQLKDYTDSAAWMLSLWSEASSQVPNLETHNIPKFQPARPNLSGRVKICALLVFATLTYWACDTICCHPLFPLKGHNWVINLKENWYLGVATTACGLIAWTDYRRQRGEEARAISTLDFNLKLMLNFYARDELSTVKDNLQKAFHNLYPGHPLPSSLR